MHVYPLAFGRLVAHGAGGGAGGAGGGGVGAGGTGIGELWPSRVMFGVNVLQSSVTVALLQRRVNIPEPGVVSWQIGST
eukprot:COSAG02_NODE_54029_length_298_cov_0.854271_1_plen_78_part_01